MAQGNNNDKPIVFPTDDNGHEPVIVIIVRLSEVIS